MSDNGSGVAVINSSGQPVVASTLITSAAMNALTADLATMLSNRICKDGQTTITQNIPFNNKKITGLGAASARTDAASLATIQDGTGVYSATVGGTADVITLTPSPTIAAYAAGQTFKFIASGANTTNVTVAVSGLAAKAITKNGTTALVSGDIPSASMVTITYDGTRFILGTTGAATIPASVVPTGAITTSGLTQATAKLLGRTTASTGAIEEITAGAGLTFSAGALTPVAASTSAAGIIETAIQSEVDAGTPVRALTTDLNLITNMAEQATTSGTAFDFTIPAGATRVCLHLFGVSLSGGDNLLIRVGDAGGIETTGYLSSGGYITGSGTALVAVTDGFVILAGIGANIYSGIVTLERHGTNQDWVCSHSLKGSNAIVAFGGGQHTGMSAPGLTTVRLTRSGTDTFDAGAVSANYQR